MIAVRRMARRTRGTVSEIVSREIDSVLFNHLPATDSFLFPCSLVLRRSIGKLSRILRS